MRRRANSDIGLIFIAKHPSAILILGGMAMVFAEKAGWASGLIPWASGFIILGVVLHVAWLMFGRR